MEKFTQKFSVLKVFLHCSIVMSFSGCITERPASSNAPLTAVTAASEKSTIMQSHLNGHPKVYGVTVDSVENTAEIVNALKKMKFRPTVRIVFDDKVPASRYVEALKQIHKVSYVMGELVDSYYMKNYTREANRKHTEEFLKILGDYVDIWEFGNEVNGEWLGPTSEVIYKISDSFELIQKEKKITALTLYYNEGCWEKPESEMFSWAKKNIPEGMRRKIDYVFISYYEDDCDGPKPDWKKTFHQLSELFPESKLGFGEVGSKHEAKKAEYIKRYYSLNVDQPRFVGGYFWWYFHQDMVPDTKPLWRILNSSLIE
jgi:hypothetical protein